jgi:hypothetical protein
MSLPADDTVLQALLAFWERTRSARAMPAKADVDPARLGAKLLPYILLIELTADNRLRFRLCGTALTEAAGTNLTGKHVDELHSNPAYTRYIDGLYRRCIADRRPNYSESRYLAHSSTVRRVARRLICPLSDDGTTVTQFISAQTFAVSVLGQDAPTVRGADEFETGVFETL